MELNPQRVRTAAFKTAKRGLDPDEVREFLVEVADALETAQNQSTAMEARARAAVARLQELSEDANSQAAASGPDDVAAATAEQAETISRTLLLAQRTADTAIAQAEAESQRLVAAATEEAAATLDSTREMAARLMEEAREEARRAGDAERMALASEVESLKARRDFLESDVDHLEQFLGAQRSRLREAAGAMIELTERVEAGLGEVRRPLLSAADDELTAVEGVPGADDEIQYADVAELAELVGDDDLFQAAGTAEPDVGTTGAGSDDPGSSTIGQVADEAAAGSAPTEWTPTESASDVDDGAGGATVLGSGAGLGEFPPEEDASELDAGAVTAGFGEGDITGEPERPESGDSIRFSFDDRR